MSSKNRKANPERVRNKYGNGEVVVIGAIDKPITSFAHGERGKYAGMVDVYTGASVTPLAKTKLMIKPTRRRNPPLLVEIDADLLPYFKTADAVNEALRAVVQATHNH